MKYRIGLSRSGLSIFLLLFLGCATMTGSDWDRRYGIATAREYKPRAVDDLTYYGSIKPLLDRRCTVCHGCYDAPCQLKLDSYHGLLRGANPEKVYDGSRLLGASLTRLFDDAATNSAWREKGFHPVINERANHSRANIGAGLIAQSLLLKKSNPLPVAAILPDSFDFNLDKKQYCPRVEEYSVFASSLPLWGMPYALPGLNQTEHELMMQWLASGAEVGVPPEQPSEITNAIHDWESYLNGDSLKNQLISRYIYEHLFLANLYFDEAPSTYFRLVRSYTPPGIPLKRISTRRPFDDPKVERVYYRLWHDPSSVVAKNHMPYALNSARMLKWNQLFFGADYEVKQLPSYAPETASNPFITFVDLPVEARYRFMLDEAQFTIMNFIKGPVCRGQVALNVIQNHFWVFFFDPKTQSGHRNAQFLRENSHHLNLPAEVGNAILPFSSWMKYAELQKEYLIAKGKFVNELVREESSLELDVIWDGDAGKNPNAALTIFRHNDSASIHQGLLGESPKTAWVIGYPLLERIHYLLVAGFDVYGNVSHQLLSRIYMDFLRMEGEMNFVEFLPKETQRKELAYWYRDADKPLKNYISLYEQELKGHNRIRYVTQDPKAELLKKLTQHVGAASESHHQLNRRRDSINVLAQLDGLRGPFIQPLPQTTIIRVPEVGVFTLLHNNAYSNLSSLFNEEKRRRPEEDSLILVAGVVGAYPNAFMLVSETDVADFVEKILRMRNELDYQHLRDTYGIRRTDARFWQFSDDLHQYYFATQANEAGLLDYNRLENR
jgi:Fatty acid cis/trans isomerase (CTI)